MEQTIMTIILLSFLLAILLIFQVVLDILIKKQHVKKKDKKQMKRQKKKKEKKFKNIKTKLNYLFPITLLIVIFFIIFNMIQLGELLNKNINVNQDQKNEQKDILELDDKIATLESYQKYPKEGLPSLKVDDSLWTDNNLQKQFKVGLTKELTTYFFQSLIIVELNTQDKELKVTLKESQNLSATSKNYYLSIVEKLLNDIEQENTIQQVTLISNLYTDNTGQVTYKRVNGGNFEEQQIDEQPVILDSSGKG